MGLVAAARSISLGIALGPNDPIGADFCFCNGRDSGYGMAYHQEWVDFAGAGDAGLLVVERKGEGLGQSKFPNPFSFNW